MTPHSTCSGLLRAGDADLTLILRFRQLRDWFQAHLTDPGFNVESVRLIRDAHSIQCKGFGYVKFNVRCCSPLRSHDRLR